MADRHPDIADRVAMMTRRMAPDAAGRNAVFLYVRIPEQLDPATRRAKYQGPLHQMLESQTLGIVVGGGQFLGPSGVAYCGVDVELYAPDRVEYGFPLLIDSLRQLGVPRATVVEEFLPSFVEHPVWPVDAEPSAAADRGGM
jgi:hypothetical protein